MIPHPARLRRETKIHAFRVPPDLPLRRGVNGICLCAIWNK